MRSRSPRSERFWPKVDKRGPDDCWNWTAGLGSSGYGSFSAYYSGSKNTQAHRVAWELTNGAVPDGLYVLHKCDNRRCCNPGHLILGTHRDNMRDMTAKGRSWQQQKTHCSKGHEYTPENTYRHEGHRYCRTCNRVAAAKLKSRREAAL